MIGFLQNIVFMNPWILAGAAGLPLLWYLLRIMPPAPQHLILPTTRFLKGLIPENQTPSHTPWWILLLRVFIALLVLIALAHPVYNPAGQLPGHGALRIVIDNSWPSATIWDRQIKAAEETLSQAGREKRQIYIVTTAPAPGEPKPLQYGPMNYAEGLSILQGLEPLPWPADYKAAKELLSEQKEKSNITSLWYAHGLNEGNIHPLIKILAAQGGLHYISPKPGNTPLLLRPSEKTTLDMEVLVEATANIPEGLPVSVQAVTADGRVLDHQSATLSPADLPAAIAFDVPEAFRNDITQFRLAGKTGPGGMLLLDESSRKRSVGIVAPAEKAEAAPFIEASYYLKRALEPYTSLHFGGLHDILEQEPSVIVLPDIGAMPPEDLDTLEGWVKKGGLLLRFSGPNMAQGQNELYLLPVPLRKGGRSLQGSLTWQEPVTIAPFDERSPFYGITVSDEIIIKQQMLPAQGQEIEDKIWASLSDGTPLITAAQLDSGMLVLIHTTATPEWSDLALSGLFVKILRRIVSISGTASSENTKTSGYLEPILTLNGFGSLQEPGSFVRSVPAKDFEQTEPSSVHPPGLYGRGGAQQALNIGSHIKRLEATAGLPVTVTQKHYGSEYESDLMPFLLYSAVILLLADWLIMIAMMFGARAFLRFATPVLLLFFIIPPAYAPAYAQEQNYADGLYLAYMRTGDTNIDTISHQGLKSLTQILKRRTSVEPAGVAGLDPERDELAFFPIIYWPVTPEQKRLSPKALGNIQSYLDHGGTILFDTRDRNYAARALSGTKNTEALRRMIGGLNLPPLMPMPENHVLGKSFYLLDSFPGRYRGGTIWVEQNSAKGRDGVSSIIIGPHDWAGAWAAGKGQRSSMSGGSRQQELAQRFGVNLVMYALTGNYKADQVHVPFILERLGQ